jgi:hypothetical protein
MGKYVISFSLIMIALAACNSQKNAMAANGPASSKAGSSKNDTIRIANDSLQYEVIIIDAGFSSWLASNAKPRNFYSQSYLESRNISWVTEWNLRARQPQRYGSLYEMEIDYRQGINYGYEVNYLLFNYLTYFQVSNNQRLGGFVPRI